MTDYIPYTVEEYQPDAPATALHFARWFQNWEAGFEGAAGAPRLAPVALEGGGYLGSYTSVGTGGAGFVGLDRVGRVRILIKVSSAGARIRFTGNGGSSWTAWQELLLGASNEVYVCDLDLSLLTGVMSLGLNIKEVGAFAVGFGGTKTLATVPPANVNGFQLSPYGGALPGFSAWISGGRT